MKKYTKKYKKSQNGANNRRKNPSDMPVIFKVLVFIEFFVFLAVIYPNIMLNHMVEAVATSMITYIILLIGWKIRYRHMLAGASIEKIDKMTGEEFEEYLAMLYRKHGFDVKMTPKTCDFGADLLLTEKKTGRKIVVQAKRYRGLVGEAAVQQTLSGREYYSCDKAVIVTNSHYTDAAKELAKRCGIKTIDRFKLGKEDMFLI